MDRWIIFFFKLFCDTKILLLLKANREIFLETSFDKFSHFFRYESVFLSLYNSTMMPQQ